MNRPVFVEKDDNFQSFTRGMASQASEARDANLDPEIQTYLFRKTKQYGDDLKSLDIQRDRDHGIGSYNDMRVAASLSRATSFDDLLDVISSTNVNSLKEVYANVNDIDLSVGGDLEYPRDSTVGHGTTYHYIFMKQFKNTRTGDRFWFESSSSPYPFTSQQLTELRKSSLSRIICDNSNGVELMQPNSFVIANSGDNAYVGCSSIPTVDLSYWKA
ncbi:hypothetical protein ACKWTF_009708 [Chironomus riparius]